MNREKTKEKAQRFAHTVINAIVLQSDIDWSHFEHLKEYTAVHALTKKFLREAHEAFE